MTTALHRPLYNDSFWAIIGPETAALFARYVERLRGEGYFEYRARAYGFGAFDNGVPIPDAARRLYLEANGGHGVAHAFAR